MMDVLAIASLLTPSDYPNTDFVWGSILEITQSANLRFDGVLHFSWHVGGQYDLPVLTTILDKIAREAIAFDIQTTGFGVFSSDHPVLYLPIVKTKKLCELHNHIWNEIRSISVRPINYYAPDQWMPHITLANEEADFDGICKAGEQLMRKPLFLSFLVDNFSILYRTGSESGIIKSFAFGGKS